MRRCRTAVREIGQRYLNDTAFRGFVSVCIGLAVNFCYAAFRTVMGILYGSVWLISSAVYFVCLAWIRAGLAISYRHRSGKPAGFERRCYRRTAWFLFILDLPMCGMIFLTVTGNAAVSYPGYTIYASAAYTFWMLTHAIVQTKRFRRLGSPILSASKAVSLVATLMSLFGLQNGMIVTFSGKEESFRQLMNALTGAGVSAVTVVIAVSMLIRSAQAEQEVPDE